MIRKVLLPAAAIALLGGCVTPYPYTYSGGGAAGDYYYGRPYVEYRDYGGYYGGLGYGYPGGWYGSFGFGGYYGGPWYGYPYHGYGYGGWPYYHGWYGGYPGYTWRYYPNPPPHGGGHHDDDDSDRQDRPQPPWRNLDDLRPRHPGDSNPPTTPLRPVMATPSQPMQAPSPTPRAAVMTPPPRREPSYTTPRPTRPARERDGNRGSEP